jgi:hypothetical protein
VSSDDLPPPLALHPPASLRARVLADAPRLGDQLPKPLPLSVVLGAGGCWIALYAYVVGRRDNWSGLPSSASWALLAEIALAAALTTVVALSRGPHMVGPSARWILGSLSVPVVLLALVALLVPNTTPTPDDAFLRFTLRCDAGATLIAIPVLVVLVYGERGRVFASPAFVGAVAGVAAATWGHAILHWGCPWTDFRHVLLGHVVPSIPLALGGALFARTLNRSRSLGH